MGSGGCLSGHSQLVLQTAYCRTGIRRQPEVKEDTQDGYQYRLGITPIFPRQHGATKKLVLEQQAEPVPSAVCRIGVNFLNGSGCVQAGRHRRLWFR